MHQHHAASANLKGLKWKIFSLTVIVPLALAFCTQIAGNGPRQAMAQAASALWSKEAGPGIWLAVLAINVAVYFYLGPVFHFIKDGSCGPEGGSELCHGAVKCLNHLDVLVIFASIGSFLLGAALNAGHARSVEASIFAEPRVYTMFREAATGFLAGVSLSVNLGNILFPIKRLVVSASSGARIRRSSLYKKVFLIISALVLFTVFLVFSSAGDFFQLGALAPGDAGAQAVLVQGIDAHTQGMRDLLSVFYAKLLILFVFIAQLFLQIRRLVTRPIETIADRLSTLGSGPGPVIAGGLGDLAGPDGHRGPRAVPGGVPPAREIEIIQNDEFSGVYELVNKLIRRQAAELSISKGRLGSITANAADPIIVYDSRGAILEFNPAAERYFGVPSEQAVGRPVWDVVEMLDAPGCPDAHCERDPATFFAEGGSESGYARYRARSRDGRELSFEAHASVAESPDEEGGRQYTAILRDILHQIEIEESLRKAKQAAENANRMKSEFLANMSHELRTPLNAVLGFTQLLAADKSLGQRQLEKVEIVSRSGEHLLALINDILDISKIEAGKVESHVEAFDLPRFLEDMKEMFAIRCERKGLSLYIETTSELPRWVEGDLGKLRQVVINLVGNAVKFTSDGGVGITVGRDCSRIRFAIVDSGKGIPADEIGLIVQPFTQSSITDHEGGTGLGLAISARFIEMMGGELEIQSEVGKGSSFGFAIELPETDSRPQDETAAEVPIAVKPGSEVTVLIVDDKETNRLVLKEMLDAAGFSTIEARNGREALERALEYRPSIVFMDIRMPEMDGYEAVRLLKERPEGSAMKVFALTASAFKHDEERIRAAGFDGFLAKPFKRAALFQLIRDKTEIEMVYERPSPSARDGSEVPDFASFDFGAALAAAGGGVAERLGALALINDFSGARALADELETASPGLAALVRRAALTFDERGMAAILDALRGAGGDA
jgi:PAS domain S-box-containing protein